MADKSKYLFGINAGPGTLPSGDDNSISLQTFRHFKNLMYESINSGTLGESIVRTYSLVYTTSASAYIGGVLAPNGDIHFIPYSANRGQKIDVNGIVSTYSLAYTTTGAYGGGVLSPNGDIHFIPCQAAVGQKITTLCAKPFDIGLCLSPFFNKF